MTLDVDTKQNEEESEERGELVKATVNDTEDVNMNTEVQEVEEISSEV